MGLNNFIVLQHIECEGLGLLEDILKERKIDFRYIKIHKNEPLPDRLENGSGLIILGGPQSVYEKKKYPFIEREEYLIEIAVSRDLGVLGICLGSQLIASACGAEVRPGGKKEIGWHDITLDPCNLDGCFFKGLPKRLKVFQWHGDTFDIPKSGLRLASSKLFPNQAFRFGRGVLALQFHLEVTEKMIRVWSEEYKKELAALKMDPKKIFEDSKRYLPSLARYAETIFNNYLDTLTD